MSLVEKLLSQLAPHDCLSCEAEGSLVCVSCWSNWLSPLPARCYKCLHLTNGSKVCSACFHKTPLRALYCRANYDQHAQQLIYKLKFERAVAAAEIIARYLDEALPVDFRGLVVPVPTASSRRRQRGYDQAELIAKHLSRRRQLTYANVLGRRGQARQVGSKRKDRLQQLQSAFYVKRLPQDSSKKILLVDDVLTTGATLEAAATMLKRVGVRRVEAIVFAQA